MPLQQYSLLLRATTRDCPYIRIFSSVFLHKNIVVGAIPCGCPELLQTQI
ncbi:MAG: hypothetical protein KAI83_01360 [Thiomargarita sp.]|nr:hypothetical protein [Thiomargarita sp.]